MQTPPAAGPNAEQITFWNQQAGPKWVAYERMLDEQIAPIGLAGMERARIAPGENILDVGCGCGQTSLQLAQRVGASGSVTGVDISAPMLARARERAAELGLRNLRFLETDAQEAKLGERFDLVFSRFGVMFFASPEAAFANLRASLAPGGRLAFVCWQEMKRNPWMLVPTQAIAQVVELPAPPPPGAPGPFSFADPERVRAILEAAGFADVAIEPFLGQCRRGDLDEAAEFSLVVGPAARALVDAGEDQRRAARAAAREALAPYATPSGVILDYASWIATARRDRP
jgi:ubiquinone/menaquinone biosynthesis C-methylase UbiE